MRRIQAILVQKNQIIVCKLDFFNFIISFYVYLN